MKKLNTKITATANLGNLDIGKEPTYGPSSCSVCGRCTSLPGHHQCNPSYKQLQAELAKANDLLFAYESVKAPINPLLAKNTRLRIAINIAIHLICSDDDFGGTKQILGIEKLEQALKGK